MNTSMKTSLVDDSFAPILRAIAGDPVCNAVDYADAADLMRRSAGSFFRTIGEAWFLADNTNRQILEAAFKTTFERYAAMARGMRS